MAALAAASWPSTSARRVALGQAELLRLAQDVVVAGALLLHAGEDVVGRAVDDPHDPDDLLAGQRLAERPDDRDGAGHRRLVEQVHARGGGHLGQLRAGGGQERLVGGDHRLAVAQGRLDQLVRRVEPADDLDHDVDVVPRHQGGGIGPDEVGRMDGARGRSGRATAMPTSSRRMPVRAATSSLRVSRISASAPPTLPHPSRATRTVGAGCARWMGAAARGCAGLLGGHLQTVQAARAATRASPPAWRISLWRCCAGGERAGVSGATTMACQQAGSLERPPAHGSHWPPGGAVPFLRLMLRAGARHRWRSWLALALLTAVVVGLVLAGAATARRTATAFPRFEAAHGYDAFFYSAGSVPRVASLPEVASVTRLARARRRFADVRLSPHQRQRLLHRRGPPGAADPGGQAGERPPAGPVRPRPGPGLVQPRAVRRAHRQRPARPAGGLVPAGGRC